MRIATILAALFVLVPMSAEAGKKKKKKGKNEPIPAGWYQEEGWMGSCYNPPDFSKFGEFDRRMKWQDARDEIVGQWRGDRQDGVSFDAREVEHFETVLLSKADRIELVAQANFEQCTKAMSGKGMDGWKQWFDATPPTLTKGECPYRPMDYTLYNYLAVTSKWQVETHVCQGDEFTVHGTTGDWYRLEKGAPWINATGDQSQPAADTDLPCKDPACYKGQLILRFVADNGLERILPVGERITFKAPDHGTIMVMINDSDLSDNVYKIESGLEHKMGIEFKPLKKK